jgi:ketosteroid isomerase-like protein
MSINLPKPIAAYFAAEKAGDAGALARCFANDGVVHDEGGSFAGRAAIERWNTTARAKYHHTVVPLSATDREGAIVVLCRVAGEFPGSPLELQHVFRLDDETIASLEIR